MKKLSVFLVFALIILLSSCTSEDKFPAVDVYGNFTKIGFTLEKPFVGSWICKQSEPGHDMIVDISGDASNVELIKGSFMCYDGNEDSGKDFLGYLASVPYPGADPLVARGWVSENYGKEAERDFGRATYRLTKNGSVIMLIIEYHKQ